MKNKCIGPQISNRGRLVLGQEKSKLNDIQLHQILQSVIPKSCTVKNKVQRTKCTVSLKKHFETLVSQLPKPNKRTKPLNWGFRFI